jgi:hypothetical protein
MRPLAMAKVELSALKKRLRQTPASPPSRCRSIADESEPTRTPETSYMKKRLLDFLGMLLVGDGLLTLADPQRHCLLWEIGPKPCRELMDECARHPTMTRCIGLTETVLGILLAEAQTPNFWQLGRRFGLRE